jgi:hypothetical protein
MSIGKSEEENIKSFMEYKLFKVNNKKMIIFLVQLLSKTLEGSKVICVCFLILSKYLSMLLRHALDQKYKF